MAKSAAGAAEGRAFDAALRRYQEIRRLTMWLAAPLSAEDQAIQSIPDVSPTKWHLAHTTWFFETFVLAPHAKSYAPFDSRFGYLFNSYYEAVGARHPRPERGLLSRPGLDVVHQYRRRVDEAVADLVAGCTAESWRALAPTFELGLNHEQQHQELILMDIKHVLSRNPLRPSYRALARAGGTTPASICGWTRDPGGLRLIGDDGDRRFAFDNEGPRHKVLLEPFLLADRLVANGEYCAFIEDGGYKRPDLWLFDGWAAVQANNWEAPLYWREEDGERLVFTLAGERPIDPAEPVCHVSYYEADAFARWSGRRLPREEEWESAAAAAAPVGHLLSSGEFHPRPAPAQEGLRQLFGDVWEWTSSAYAAYPGYRPPAGALGEYNGKFMSGRFVLRGGSAATPEGHVRATYRNYFPPDARWAFSGIRLADDA
jgi:ergothioneine biosynthesis protein EgtB